MLFIYILEGDHLYLKLIIVTKTLFLKSMKCNPGVKVISLNQSFLICLETKSKENTVVIGDFNIHVNQPSRKVSKDFNSLLFNCGLEQHLNVPTHTGGHTLDWLITEIHGTTPKDIISHDLAISDHFTLRCFFDFTKPETGYKTLKYRDRKNIDISAFKTDILYVPYQDNQDISSSAAFYNESMNSLSENHLPTITRRIKISPNRKWYNQILRDERTKRRRLERKKKQNM